MASRKEGQTMVKSATISNYEAEAIMEALSFFIHKHGPEHMLTDAMQRMFKVIRENDTIRIKED